jgi:predicted Zn-dependent protease
MGGKCSQGEQSDEVILMAGFDVKTFQRKVPIGSEVLLMLRTGREVQGRLIEIREQDITLRNANGEVTLLLEMLAGWETLEAPHEDSHATSPPQQVAVVTPQSVSLPVEVIAKVVEIETRFRTEAQKADIRPLPPDFRLPKNQLSSHMEKRVRQELDRLKNKWDYAHKVNELSRLNAATQDCKLLAQNHPDISIFAFDLGCFYLELNKLNEALSAFRQAIQGGKSKDPKGFFNLAATALKVGRRQVACYALQQFFRRESPVNHPTVWQLCVGLSAEFQALAPLVETTLRCAKSPNEALTVLLIETIVCLLKWVNQVDDAHAIAVYLLPNAPTMPPLQELINTSASKLPTSVDAAYDQEIKNFLAESERQIQEQQKAKQIEALIREAKSWAQRSNLAQAIGVVRKVYELDRDNVEAKRLESTWQEQIKRSQDDLLPPRQGTYREAKKADLDKNLKKAERLYREAIAQGDNWESAIKDLAMLLSRQGRDEEAIELLRSQPFERVQNKRALFNTLVNLYQRVGQYDEAIKCLSHLRAGATRDELLRILKQTAFCQLKAEQYDAAEQTLQTLLKQQPNDLTAQRWLERLRLARETGRQADLEVWFKAKELLTEFETSLSDFLTFHIERCQYEGVAADRVAGRNFSERDVYVLNDLADRLGTARPRERSQYYLSAARILMDLGEAQEFRIGRSLRNFCAAMGDACVAEGKHLDIARAYYSEAFLIAPEWVEQLEIKLAQFIMSFYASVESLLRPNPPVQDCLTSTFAVGELGVKVVQELLHLSVVDVDVATFLLPKVFQSSDLQEKVTNSCCISLELSGESSPTIGSQEDLMKLWEEGRKWAQSQQQELIDELRVFQSTAPTWDALQDQIQRLNVIRSKLRGDLDRQRADKTREILQFIIDYSRQTDYGEQERMALLIQNRCNTLMQEIEAGPTKISLELFYPYVRALQSFIVSHFQQVQVAAEPDISVALAVDEYIPDNKSAVECQINLSNRAGKSPASAVGITIEKSPEREYRFNDPTIALPESLRGGASVTCEVPVIVTERAKQAQVFTLYYSLAYTTRSGRQVVMPRQSLPVRLYPASRFREIENPYAPYTEGGPVEDPKMFVGRDEFIENMLATLQASPTNKSLVIYGQKRTGKSSILLHMEKRLRFPFIPVRLSIGDVVADLSGTRGLAVFLGGIARRINEALEDVAETARFTSDVPCPPAPEFQQSPQSCLDDYLTRLQRAFARTEACQKARIVLLLDEFTYLYNEIMKGNLPDTFMKVWKALLERNYFSSVVVGQDVMPKFMARFPNEFQVAQRERVSYLSAEHARRLIEDPIRIPETGESRFRGAAVERLVALTAGNPFYLQIFCSRLVEYMNLKKAVYVTDANIEEVKKQLIRGANSLTQDYFDNLVSSGDESSGALPHQVIWEVLRQVTIGSRNQEHCPRSSITAQTSVPVEDILEDLVSREVLERRGRDFFKIKVGLFKEWLLVHE